MIDSSDTRTLSRRTALAGLAAATLAPITAAEAGIPPAAAIANNETDREEWLARWQRYAAAEWSYIKADNAHDEARFAARKLYPKQPRRYPGVAGAFRNGEYGPVWTFGPFVMPRFLLDSRNGRLYSRQDVEDYFTDCMAEKCLGVSVTAREVFEREGAEYRDRALADYDAWQQQCDAIDAKHGVPSLKAAYDAAGDAWVKSGEEIIKTPAASLAGVAVKLGFGFVHVDEELEELDWSEQAGLDALKSVTAMLGLPVDYWKIDHPEA